MGNIPFSIPYIFTDNYALTVFLKDNLIPLLFDYISFVNDFVYSRHHLLLVGKVFSITNMFVDNMFKTGIVFTTTPYKVNIANLITMPHSQCVAALLLE